jgi:dolichyl-phosphate beta-glucosyltransferase
VLSLKDNQKKDLYFIKDSPFVSLVIPAYNEENRIKKSLVNIQKYLDQQPYKAQLIIVDDGSRDKTIAVAENALNNNHNHKILHYSDNKGKGYAVRKGVLEANGKYIFFMDADLSTPIQELNPFLEALEKGYDIVIGTRRNKESKIEKKQPKYREILGQGFTVLTNAILVKKITDITCGFKGFKKDIGKSLFERQIICNWSFDAEVMFLAQKYNYTIKELPVRWHDEQGSKVKLYRDIVGSLKGIVQIRVNNFRGIYK